MKIKYRTRYLIPNGLLPLSAVVLLVLLSACATRTGQTGSPQWRCDPAADAAFERGDWQMSLTGHETLLSSDTTNGLAYYHLGFIYGKLGLREQEVSAYQQALSRGYRQDDQLYVNLGMSLGDLGRMDDAEQALQKAIEIDPQNADNYFGLGILVQASQKWDQAAEAFKKAVKISSDHWEARLALARIYLNQDRRRQAEHQLQAILTDDPQNEEAIELQRTLESRRSTRYD